MKNKKLSWFNVAALYVGTIMGAGFASGREGWQFFGVFGRKGYLGLAVAGALFMILGMMVSYIARVKKTDDMGKIIVFSDSPRLTGAVGYLMAGILYTIIISMSAAGGSFLHQQFGLPTAVGGIIIVVLVILTVLGNFERISKVFKIIVPALFVIDVTVCMLVIFSDIQQSGATSGFPASSMASNWFLAAFIFTSYNMLGMIPIIGASSVNAKSKGHAIIGAGAGGFLLTVLTFVLITGLRKDMAFTQEMDLPMLAYSARISPVANVLFGTVLFAAIYSAATSTYYGFSTKIKESPGKKYILIIGAVIGFACGLTGFKTMVAYLYPAEGYIGFAVIISIVINFFKVRREEKQGKIGETVSTPGDQRETPAADKAEPAGFPGHDPHIYPENICRVTAGQGGEALLIFGEEKTALYDCGMAYCHEGLIENIRSALEARGRDTLDLVLLSHTHYDHIGALPYVLMTWPETVVCASGKAKQVFSREGARRTMKRLGEAARNTYGDKTETIVVDPLRVDLVVGDGDRIPLGDHEYIAVLETPGHTDCSLTYVLEPDAIMFASESTGVLQGPQTMETAILKSYEDSMAAAAKCRAYAPKQIVGIHYGMVPKSFTKGYFDLYVASAEEEKNFILDLYDAGLSREEITDRFVERYWSEARGKAQPKEAFLENTKYVIKHILEVFRDAQFTD